MLSLKIRFEDEIHRVSSEHVTSFDELVSFVKTSFIKRVPEHFLLKYLDDENDLVTCFSQSSFNEALSLSRHEGRRVLVFSVVRDTRPKRQPAPAAPATPAKEETGRRIRFLCQQGGAEVHALRFDESTLASHAFQDILNEVRSKAAVRLERDTSACALQYVDDEGDVVSVRHAADFLEALEVLQSLQGDEADLTLFLSHC
ncbi:MAG: hypothetical protein MHM6MM_003359 [Cercozoa sp. M6MM]